MKKKYFLGLLIILLLVISSCKKRKIDTNLNGAWLLSELTLDGLNEVTPNASFTLEFTDVEKGEGTVRLISIDSQNTYITSGVVTVDKKYKTMSMTLNDAGYTIHMDGSFDVTEYLFTLTGTFSNDAGNTYVLSIKGVQ